MTRDPNSDLAVWVDQDGEVCFDQPGEGCIMTFEERHIPPHGASLNEDHFVPALQRFHFGVDETELKMVVPEDEAELVEKPELQSRSSKAPK